MQKLCFDIEKSEKRRHASAKNAVSSLFFALVEAFLEAVFVTVFLHFCCPVPPSKQDELRFVSSWFSPGRAPSAAKRLKSRQKRIQTVESFFDEQRSNINNCGLKAVFYLLKKYLRKFLQVSFILVIFACWKWHFQTSITLMTPDEPYIIYHIGLI